MRCEWCQDHRRIFLKGRASVPCPECEDWDKGKAERIVDLLETHLHESPWIDRQAAVRAVEELL